MTVSKAFWIGLALLVAGALLIALAIRLGEAQFALVIFIPVIYGSSGYLALGALLIFVGFFLLLMGYFEPVSVSAEELGFFERKPQNLPPGPAAGGQGGQQADSRGKTQGASYGGFLFIGPVPVVFGSRAEWFPYIVLLAVVTAIVFILFAVLLFLR
jgi:uncharacterized protein (TIGR00304 family)